MPSLQTVCGNLVSHAPLCHNHTCLPHTHAAAPHLLQLHTHAAPHPHFLDTQRHQYVHAHAHMLLPLFHHIPLTIHADSDDVARGFGDNGWFKEVGQQPPGPEDNDDLDPATVTSPGPQAPRQAHQANVVDLTLGSPGQQHLMATMTEQIQRAQELERVLNDKKVAAAKAKEEEQKIRQQQQALAAEEQKLAATAATAEAEAMQLAEARQRAKDVVSLQDEQLLQPHKCGPQPELEPYPVSGCLFQPHGCAEKPLRHRQGGLRAE